MNELDPLAAVTAPDPYPYYERVVAERPFYRDGTLGLWVAASARAVEEVLSSPVMRVRPASEPVPKAIAETPMADVFARLVRMTDGRHQAAVKDSIAATLDLLDQHELAATSERCASLLERSLEGGDSDALRTYAFGLPAFIIATELGLSPEDSSHAVAWTSDFVRSISPGAVRAEVDRGVVATDRLNTALGALLRVPAESGSLFAAFLAAGRRHGIDDAVIVANSIGFLFQSYDATAGLIGNALVALGRDAGAVRDARREDERSLSAFVEEVARHDAPIQNTRRFAATDTTVMGCDVSEGEGILVLLAAANRDPSVNPDPHRFDPARTGRRTYAFGLGAHACPGARIATTIARVAVSRLLKTGIDPRALTPTGYRPSPNARIPEFAPATLRTGVAR
jgi:cytochrome P450